MQFEKDHIFHIYNQGNNRQKLFFERENYLFFLRKIKTYILPYADILAWCLMPNHFHLMVLVNEVAVGVDKTVGVAQSDTDGDRK
ncbi:MAG: transposase [Draconibacterium sp.]